MFIYREYEHRENYKRLVLEIIFREGDGKMKSVSGLIKSGKEPKGGFRKWCKQVATDIRRFGLIYEQETCKLWKEFGWDSAELTRTNQICEFSRKHPHGFVGIIQLKKEKENDNS